MARNIELTEDLLNNIPEYADNAAAVAGGLVAGNYYYNTTSDTITKVA